ncbi:MAG: Tex family protein [Desulfoprunum sp.]|nr:Tex family protein [Desulfoprunum sp.]
MTEQTSNIAAVAKALQIDKQQVSETVTLLENGATVPFIARYRKEATGSLDEVVITAIRDQLQRLAEKDKRRQAIVESLEKLGLLTEPLHKQLLAAESLTELEDIYLPFRPKRRTRGMIAREKGLEPLAAAIFRQSALPVDAALFIDPAKGVESKEDALAGARDIIAEQLSEDARSRAGLRQIFRNQAVLSAKVVKKNQEQGSKFRDYFDWQEAAGKAAGHRLLAMFRGENEKVLTLSFRPPEEAALLFLKKHHLQNSPVQAQIEMAIEDSYKRLIAPSLENELRGELKDKADREATGVFAANLRELLLAPPMGEKRVLALDPGYRTGAKLVCLDGQGRLLHNTTVYPTQSEKKLAEAAGTVTNLVKQFAIEAIAIGNGTAGRETEEFVRSLGLAKDIIITLVNEDGASIYSASEVARREFPDHDITVRGAVSIGRRLQDPLAELVKIDPKSIGVGQYQHDINQAELKKSLDEVVVSCVNKVGVELNTASLELLTSVSGLGPVLAGNIISHRDKVGPFTDRSGLLQVPRLGPRAYEQCAGFLRIRGAVNPLDNSAVHPERYKIVARMARDAGVSVVQLMGSETARKSLVLDTYLTPSVGLPTLQDIISELAKPGRDPRQSFIQFQFAEGIHDIADLHPGMLLPGIITNVTKFGAFADIGVHQDGLIHISQMADRYVKDPSEVVKVRQQVEVRVLEIDKERKRIALSLKKQD